MEGIRYSQYGNSLDLVAGSDRRLSDLGVLWLAQDDNPSASGELLGYFEVEYEVEFFIATTGNVVGYLDGLELGTAPAASVHAPYGADTPISTALPFGILTTGHIGGGPIVSTSDPESRGISYLATEEGYTNSTFEFDDPGTYEVILQLDTPPGGVTGQSFDVIPINNGMSAELVERFRTEPTVDSFGFLQEIWQVVTSNAKQIISTALNETIGSAAEYLSNFFGSSIPFDALISGLLFTSQQTRLRANAARGDGVQEVFVTRKRPPHRPRFYRSSIRPADTLALFQRVMKQKMEERARISLIEKEVALLQCGKPGPSPSPSASSSQRVGLTPGVPSRSVLSDWVNLSGRK